MDYLLLILSGLTVYLVFTAFLGPIISKEALYKRRINDIRDKNIRTLYDKYQAENSFVKTIFTKLQPLIDRMSKNDTDKNEEKFKETSQLLYSAGVSMSPSTYLFIEKVVSIISVIIGIFLMVTVEDVMAKMLFLLISIIAPYILFRFTLKSKVTLRKNLIARQLPDILDLLSISVDAGMGFDQALSYVVTDMDGPLIDELVIVVREMGLGRSRKDAFKNLAERLSIESVSNFTSAVVQSTEMGISMQNMLKTQAEVARTTRINAVKAKAAKASIKMLIPMVCFIFPVLFIILMGPAVLNMIKGGFM